MWRHPVFMVHIPQKSVHSLSPESRQTELGLLDAEIATLRADNKSLRAINRILEREKKELEAEVETLRGEMSRETDPRP